MIRLSSVGFKCIPFGIGFTPFQTQRVVDDCGALSTRPLSPSWIRFHAVTMVTVTTERIVSDTSADSLYAPLVIWDSVCNDVHRICKAGLPWMRQKKFYAARGADASRFETVSRKRRWR